MVVPLQPAMRRLLFALLALSNPKSTCATERLAHGLSGAASFFAPPFFLPRILRRSRAPPPNFFAFLPPPTFFLAAKESTGWLALLAAECALQKPHAWHLQNCARREAGLRR